MIKEKPQKDNTLFNDSIKKIITENFPCPVKSPYRLKICGNCFIFFKTLPFEILCPVTGTLTDQYSNENFTQITINVKNKYELVFTFNKANPSLTKGREIIKNQYIGECKNKLILYINNLQERSNNKCQKPSALTEES